MPGLSALTARAYFTAIRQGQSGPEGWADTITGSGPGKASRFKWDLGI